MNENIVDQQDRMMTPEESKQDTLNRLRDFVVTKLKKPEKVETLVHGVSPMVSDEEWMDGSFLWKFGMVNVEITFNVSNKKFVSYTYVSIITEGRSLRIYDLPPEFMEKVHGWIHEVVDAENQVSTAELIRSNLALEWIFV